MWIFLQNKLLPSTLNIAHVVFPTSWLLLLRSRHWTATLKILPLVELIKFEIFLLTCLRKYSTGLFHGIFVTSTIRVPTAALKLSRDEAHLYFGRHYRVVVQPLFVFCAYQYLQLICCPASCKLPVSFHFVWWYLFPVPSAVQVLNVKFPLKVKAASLVGRKTDGFWRFIWTIWGKERYVASYCLVGKKQVASCGSRKGEEIWKNS